VAEPQFNIKLADVWTFWHTKTNNVKIQNKQSAWWLKRSKQTYAKYFLNNSCLGIVMHFVLESWLMIALSSSSKPPIFFSLFTRLLTAFSGQILSFLSSPPFLSSSNRLTTDGDVWNIDGSNDIMYRSLLVTFQRQPSSKQPVIRWRDWPTTADFRSREQRDKMLTADNARTYRYNMLQYLHPYTWIKPTLR